LHKRTAEKNHKKLAQYSNHSGTLLLLQSESTYVKCLNILAHIIAAIFRGAMLPEHNCNTHHNTEEIKIYLTIISMHFIYM
jgi:hypothetical protein